MTTQPIYWDRNSGRVVAATSHTTILKSSTVLKWDGLQLEIARNHGWKVDDLMVNGHALCLNLSSDGLEYKIRNEMEWQSARLAPLNFLIQPEGKPFSLHHDEAAYYASVFVDGAFLDEVVGYHCELRAENSVADEVLASIAQSLIGILADQNADSELARLLIRAFVFRLAKRHGCPAPACIKGGIAPRQLNHLLAWLENSLQGSLTVGTMAAHVGLSDAHFSREFKRSTGHTPWEFVVDLRLDRARQALEAGESITETARRYGFSDRPHLTRLFRSKYGVTPSYFIKSRRGWYAE